MTKEITAEKYESFNSDCIDPNALKGLTVFLTGSFHIGKDKAKELVNSTSGKIKSSLDSEVKLLIAGDKGERTGISTNRIKRAKELKIEFLTEEEFLNRISDKSKDVNTGNKYTQVADEDRFLTRVGSQIGSPGKAIEKCFSLLEDQGIRARAANCDDITDSGKYRGAWVSLSSGPQEELLEKNSSRLYFGALDPDINLQEVAEKIVQALEESDIFSIWNGNPKLGIEFELDGDENYRDLFDTDSLIEEAFRSEGGNQGSDEYRVFEELIFCNVDEYLEKPRSSFIEDVSNELKEEVFEEDEIENLDWDLIWNALHKFTDG